MQVNEVDSFDNLSFINVPHMPEEDESEWLQKAATSRNNFDNRSSFGYRSFFDVTDLPDEDETEWLRKPVTQQQRDNVTVTREPASDEGLKPLASPLNSHLHKCISTSKPAIPVGDSRLAVMKNENGSFFKPRKPIINDKNLSHNRLGSANAQSPHPVRRLVAPGETYSQPAKSFMKPKHNQILYGQEGLRSPQYNRAIPPQSKSLLKSPNIASMLSTPTSIASNRPQSRIPTLSPSPSTPAGRITHDSSRIPSKSYCTPKSGNNSSRVPVHPKTKVVTKLIL